MTERTDLTTDWGEATRLIEVASPSTDIILQDLHDTLRSNTKQAGEGHDDNQDDDPLVDSAGKEALGGGVLVGIGEFARFDGGWKKAWPFGKLFG